MLYYQFIKHAFGLKYSNKTGKNIYLKIMLDDIPLKGDDKAEFLNFICILAGYSALLPLFCPAFLWNLPDFAKQAKIAAFQKCFVALKQEIFDI